LYSIIFFLHIWTIIYDLLEIFESTNDNIVKNTSHIAEKIGNYKFILSVLCWYDISQKINIVSKSLQSHQINIPQCLSLIQNVTGFLRDYRENGFINIEINAKDLAAQMNISPEFPSVLQFRLKKRNLVVKIKNLQMPNRNLKQSSLITSLT